MMPVDVRRTIALVRAYLDAAAAECGDPLTDLRHRLEGVKGLAPPRSPREQLEFERAAWIDALDAVLSPEERKVLVRSLGQGRRGLAPTDFWWELDPQAVSLRAKRRTQERLQAQVEALRACQMFERSGEVRYLRAAVSCLEREPSIGGARRVGRGIDTGFEVMRLWEAVNSAIGTLAPAIVRLFERIDGVIPRSDQRLTWGV